MGLSAAAAYLGATSNTVNTDRKLVEYMCGAQEGVTTPGAFLVGPVSGQHKVTIAAGALFAAGRNVVASQGFYFGWSDADVLVDLPAPVANPFYATVLLRIADSQYGTLPGSEGSYFQILSGTAAASPVPISDAAIVATNVPGAWYRLADVRINTANTGEIPAGQFVDTRKLLPSIADQPDIRVTQVEPTTRLVTGKTVWISW